MPLRKSSHDYNMCNPAIAFLKSMCVPPRYALLRRFTSVDAGLRLAGTLNA
jgi:hypothetical protein